MDNVIKPEDFFKDKAYQLYKESEKEDEDYQAVVNQFDIKQKNGNMITEADVMDVIDQMQKLHNSVETHKQAVIAEKTAKKFDLTR